MPEVLYLDTARLGRMSLGAQHAQSEFHSLAGDIGCSMYFEEFLREGFPKPRDGFPLLNSWRGINGLKQRLKQFVAADADSRVLLANRSTQLMTLAAHLLAGRCRSVLITDLCWPAYARILRTVATTYNCRVSCLALRRHIFADRMTANELIEEVTSAYLSHDCDGLFLPLVDNLGVHVPVRECIATIKAQSHLQFVAVDGAQALGHVPIDVASLGCDLFLAGCHKWLRTYQPLGLGYFGRPESSEYVEDTLDQLRHARAVDDPLLDFTEDIHVGRKSAFGETVNLSPLFTCHGALQDAEEEYLVTNQTRWQQEHEIDEATVDTSWRRAVVDDALRSNIVMLEPVARLNCTPDSLRQQLHQAGVALTVYSNDSLRLSLPPSPMTQSQRVQLAAALRQMNLRRQCDGKLARAS